MAEDLLFGLTSWQIARLAAWHRQAFGWMPVPSAGALIEMRREWDCRWPNLPTNTIALLGLQQPELDWPWATKVMQDARNDHFERNLRMPPRPIIQAKWH